MKEKKMEMFKKMLELEHLSKAWSEGHIYDHRNYFEQAEGFYKALEMLGWGKEYVKRSIGK